MARVHLLLCFTLLFASVTILDVVSAHLSYKPALPQIEDPQTVNDVEGYTVKVVMVFVSDLEKECPKTSKFKFFFEKLRAYAKYVCPIKRNDQKDYDLDMKAKAGGLLKAISSFAIGKIKEEIQEEKMEAIQTFKWMKSVALRIMGGRKKDEGEANMKLTAEQQKEIKEGILKWETVITRITNTMVQSTTTSSSSSESSSSEKESSGSKGSFKDTTGSSSKSGSPSGESPSSSPTTKSSSSESSTSEKESSGSKGSFKDTTGSYSKSGSPSGESPSSSPSGSNSPVESGTKTSAKDTSGGKSTVSSGSPTNSPSEDSKKSTTSESVVSASESKAMTVTEVETQTSEQVMAFIMNLEKKCPQKEEYKLFFENLKGTMTTGSSKASSPKRKGLFSRIKSAAGKISEGMALIRSRIGTKSAEVKKSMENYQGEVMKTIQELDAIHSQIVSQQQSKKGGALTCTAAQQAEIKQTIVRWEQVTTQFVETAIQSESSSSSSSSEKVQAN